MVDLGHELIENNKYNDSSASDNLLTITISAAGKCSIKVLGYEEY